MEIKLFFREPMAVFFVLVFPLMMLFLFGSIYGNKPVPFFGGVGYVDTAVPAFTAMIIATSGLITLTIQVASYREKKILRRLRATPLRPQAILSAQVITVFLMTVLGMILLLAAGKWVYGLRFSGSAFNVFIAFTLCSLSFFVLGFVLAGFFSTARTAQAAAMVIFYPMLFISGAAIPLEVLPETLRNYARVLPLTHVVTLLRGLWIGNGWSDHLTEVIFLTVMLVLGLIISAKTFRWE